jgi:hypothetical protein
VKITKIVENRVPALINPTFPRWYVTLTEGV